VAGFTTRGAVVGGIVSLALTVGLTIGGPAVMVDVLGYDSALFPYPYPTIVALPAAFLTMWIVSVTDGSTHAARERSSFAEMLVRSELGPLFVAAAHGAGPMRTRAPAVES
jgi:cation/acetate symporter